MNCLVTWLTGMKPNWHRICVSKNALLIHHISYKRQWTKPLNEAIVSKIHIGTGTKAPASSKQRLSYVLPNWHRICVSKNALLIHHISHKSQWTKPLNESIVSKIHIDTLTESYLQRSSFDSVHFLKFCIFFFASRYGMVEFLFLLFRR